MYQAIACTSKGPVYTRPQARTRSRPPALAMACGSAP